jgi:folate-binding protein YgfZ
MSLDPLRKSLLATTSLYYSPRFDWVVGKGKDCVAFLHRVTTGDIAGAKSMGGAPTLLLDTKSRVLFASCAFVAEASVRMVAPAGQGQGLAQGLSKFAIMDDCQFDPLPGLGLISILGPNAGNLLESEGFTSAADLLGSPVLSHREFSHPTLGPVWLAHVAELGADGIWVAGTEDNLATLVQALGTRGVPSLGAKDVERLRILAMEPRVGSEILPDRFPVEVGLGRAICHAKGCYVGQETIVRMRDRGNCRRRLVLLELDTTDVPGAGDILDAPTRPTAGQITSAIDLPDGKAAALALLSTPIPVGVTLQIHHHDRLLQAVVVAESKPFEG